MIEVSRETRIDQLLSQITEGEQNPAVLRYWVRGFFANSAQALTGISGQPGPGAGAGAGGGPRPAAAVASDVPPVAAGPPPDPASSVRQRGAWVPELAGAAAPAEPLYASARGKGVHALQPGASSADRCAAQHSARQPHAFGAGHGGICPACPEPARSELAGVVKP